MTEAEIRLEARLIALTYMCAHLQKVVWNLSGAGKQLVEQTVADCNEMFQGESFPHLSPEMSDAMSDEMHSVVKIIMEGALEMWCSQNLNRP